VIYIIPKHPS